MASSSNILPKNFYVTLIVFVTCSCLCRTLAIDEVSKRQLVLVQLVIRNGVTAPSTLYPNDPNDAKTWDRDLGELTLVGARQHYAIGKHLRNRYSDLITANPHEIQVNSAFRSRYMNSALSQLASLYAPTKDWQFVEGYNWQPVPVSYVPDEQDKFLGPLQNCPSLVKEMERAVNTEAGQKILEKYKDQLSYWSTHSGLSIRDWNSAAMIYEILEAEKEYGKTVPDWAQTHWEDLRALRDVAYNVNFNNPRILRVLGGPLLHQLSSNAVQKVIDDNDSQKHRMFMYSGGAVHVAGVLGALGVSDSKAPPHAATFILELFSTSSGSKDVKDYSVRLAYLNSTAPNTEVGQPHVLRYPGCEEFCPLDHFSSDVSRWNNDDWEEECKDL